MTDAELLDSFGKGDQRAFAELVGRHIDTVYSAARRQMRNAEQADDVTQAVFIILTQKAAKLDRRVPLGAWLLKTTHFACLDARKRLARRRRHEQAAALLAARREQEMLNSESNRNDQLDEIGAELDAAMAALSDRDRGAITLRYFDGMSVNQTADALGTTPAAAGKRITRAIERLRHRLRRRGVNVPSATLAVALGQIPRFAASAALTHTVAMGVNISAASNAGAAIAKGTLNIMKWIKLKIAASILIGTAVAAAAGTEAVVMLQNAPQPPVQAQTPVPAAPVAVQPANDGVVANAPDTFVGTLNNGVSMEVIGVSENPSRRKPWWKADGSPLVLAPYNRMFGSVTPAKGSGRITREVAVVINDQSNQGEKAEVRWSVVETEGTATGGVQPERQGLEASAVILEDDPNGFTVRAEVAAGAWTTLFSTVNNPYGNTSSQSEAGLFGIGARSILWGPALKDGSRTRIVGAYSGSGADGDFRMLAIDRAGGEHPAHLTNSIGNGSTIIGEFVSDLPIDQIKKWELQNRPFDQWIEIRHVSIHPGKNAGVQIATSDNP